MIDDELAAKVAAWTPPELPSPVLSLPQEIVKRRQQSMRPDPMAAARNALHLAENPDKMLEVLEMAGDEIGDVAPETTQDLRDTMSRAMFFLASKAPKEKPSTPGMPPLPPPRQDVLKFERYLRAVDDPTSILDDAEAGTLSPEGVEAVKMVYPRMYEMMQADLAARVENMPKVSYKRRMQISALLGQDMTGTLNPTMGLMAQQTYGVAGGQPQLQRNQQMPVYRAKGLRMAERSAEYDSVARRNAQIGGRR